MAVAWEITHSVETNASPAFAWNYWTEVTNWDDPPAKFELDGPFACGSRGTTRLPGQEPLHWFIREVDPPHAATIEMQLEGAPVSFEWRVCRQLTNWFSLRPYSLRRNLAARRPVKHAPHRKILRSVLDLVFDSGSHEQEVT